MMACEGGKKRNRVLALLVVERRQSDFSEFIIIRRSARAWGFFNFNFNSPLCWCEIDQGLIAA
jgi:hypothetical protein